ncbi:MAG: hypothetical protein MHM6MM_000669 [Cercozoa sp. M6MM]
MRLCLLVLLGMSKFVVFSDGSRVALNAHNNEGELPPHMLPPGMMPPMATPTVDERPRPIASASARENFERADETMQKQWSHVMEALDKEPHRINMGQLNHALAVTEHFETQLTSEHIDELRRDETLAHRVPVSDESDCASRFVFGPVPPPARDFVEHSVYHAADVLRAMSIGADEADLEMARLDKLQAEAEAKQELGKPSDDTPTPTTQPPDARVALIPYFLYAFAGAPRRLVDPATLPHEEEEAEGEEETQRTQLNAEEKLPLLLWHAMPREELWRLMRDGGFRIGDTEGLRLTPSLAAAMLRTRQQNRRLCDTAFLAVVVLDKNAPVVASDEGERPEAKLVFHGGDVGDFLKRTALPDTAKVAKLRESHDIPEEAFDDTDDDMFMRLRLPLLPPLSCLKLGLSRETMCDLDDIGQQLADSAGDGVELPHFVARGDAIDVAGQSAGRDVHSLVRPLMVFFFPDTSQMA